MSIRRTGKYIGLQALPSFHTPKPSPEVLRRSALENGKKEVEERIGGDDRHGDPDDDAVCAAGGKLVEKDGDTKPNEV
jgi:hypothetical protein